MVLPDTLNTMKWAKIQLPDPLHKWLRIRAVTNDQTLGEAIVELLQEAMDRESKKK